MCSSAVSIWNILNFTNIFHIVTERLKAEQLEFDRDVTS
jgi:hypothetical protein